MVCAIHSLVRCVPLGTSEKYKSNTVMMQSTTDTAATAPVRVSFYLMASAEATAAGMSRSVKSACVVLPVANHARR